MTVRKLRLPLGWVAVAALVSLATLGMVVGMWSKVLDINGAVATGELDGGWQTFQPICPEFHFDDQGQVVSGEFGGKNVATTRASVDPAVKQKFVVTIDNAYPGYHADCEVEFFNNGTIPADIVGITIAGGPNLNNCELNSTNPNAPLLVCDELEVVLVDGVGSQILPGLKAGASSLRIEVKQPAVQNAPKPYTFQVRICIAQFNANPTLADCIAEAKNLNG